MILLYGPIKNIIELEQVDKKTYAKLQRLDIGLKVISYTKGFQRKLGK